MYKTLAEKEKVFNQNTINTEKELDALITALSPRNCLRFRGVSESKYTMLTSLQRKCPATYKGTQKDYMTQLLYRVKSDAAVVNYFQTQGIAINDISCMALMQHLGLPTPMLDFSTDIIVALSFAADGVNLASENDETDNYVSLYVFDKVFENELGIPMQQVYMDGMVTGIQRWQEHLQQNPSQTVDASILFDLNRFVRWNDIQVFELAYIEYQPLAPGVVTLSGQNLNLSNPNLTRQKGCFILNLYPDNMPMEENWNMRTVEQRNQFWMNSVPGVRTLPYSGAMTRERLTCYDIKKEVITSWAQANAVQLYDNSPEVQSVKARMNEIQDELNDLLANVQ